MAQSGNATHADHTIDIPMNDATSQSTSHRENHNHLDELNSNRGPSNEVPPIPESSFGTAGTPNLRTTTFTRRERGNLQTPVISGLWISIEFAVNLSLIIAAISVLSVSRNEHPRAPLFEWVIGYMVGCIASIPHLYWRFLHRNCQNIDQEPAGQGSSSQRNLAESSSFAVVSSAHAPEVVSSSGVSRNSFPIASPRVYALIACYKLTLDCFFAVWFVVGNVWVFGGRSSVEDSPNLYRLCTVFLVLGFIGYALPFLLCMMICCCLPCIISMVGFHEDLDLNKGATTEVIDALVAYKFKSKRFHDGDVGEDNDGVLGAGTDRERIISAEDAICCICLSKFSNNEDLRELPCGHVFHMECVDKWLKINALCPLCKAELGASTAAPDANSGGHQTDNGAHNDVESQR